MELQNGKHIETECTHRGIKVKIIAVSTDNMFPGDGGEHTIDKSKRFIRISTESDGSCLIDLFFCSRTITLVSVYHSNLSVNEIMILNAKFMIDNFIANN